MRAARSAAREFRSVFLSPLEHVAGPYAADGGFQHLLAGSGDIEEGWEGTFLQCPQDGALFQKQLDRGPGPAVNSVVEAVEVGAEVFLGTLADPVEELVDLVLAASLETF